ncbi:hypothetical protein [Nostoc sp.]|uniref:hypothetical protein n=1 Tax=Nostoc sp. TaxID=1180 RepID=UPI002FFC1A70
MLRVKPDSLKNLCDLLQNYFLVTSRDRTKSRLQGCFGCAHAVLPAQLFIK